VEAHNIRAALADLPFLTITSATTSEDVMASVRQFTSFNQCMLGVTHFSGLTPWERHPDGDELLYVLDGEIDVTILTDAGRVLTTVSVGSVSVVPRGLWHRQEPRPSVTLLFATPSATTEVSWADDPRRE
jgi:mannose-6-phosphate isomerase-like protein (cupin superfamily)